MTGLCVKECKKYKEWTAQTYSASVCYLCWNDVLNSPCLFCTIASRGTGTSLMRAEGSDIWNNGLLSCSTIHCPSHHMYVWVLTRKHERISGVDFLPMKYHRTPALGISAIRQQQVTELMQEGGTGLAAGGGGPFVHASKLVIPKAEIITAKHACRCTETASVALLKRFRRNTFQLCLPNCSKKRAFVFQ